MPENRYDENRNYTAAHTPRGRQRSLALADARVSCLSTSTLIGLPS
jgi:hypothetical protein